MAVSLDSYAFSYGHGVVLVDDRQFLGVQTVSVNQEVVEGFVYGTDPRPLKRSVGQVQAGRGNLVFSDYEDGLAFYGHLRPQPLMKLWTLRYTLAREDLATTTIECKGCRLTGTGIDHNAGPEALSIAFPFSFLTMNIDGIDAAFTAKGAIQSLLTGFQSVRALF